MVEGREVVSKDFANYFPLFLFIIQVAGVLFMGGLYFIVTVYLHGFKMQYSGWQAKHFHMLSAPFAFLYLSGQGILLFRLMRNVRTATVKVFHSLIHSGTILLGVMAIYAMYNGKEQPFDEYRKFQHTDEMVPRSKVYTPMTLGNIKHLEGLHSYLGYVAVTFTFVSYIMGGYLYLLETDPSIKEIMSGIHSLCGVFTLITSGITASCGVLTILNDQNYFNSQRIFQYEDEYQVGYGTIVAISVFSWFILCVVINPLFLWQPIGPI